MEIALSAGVALTVFWLGWMVGETTAMRRERRHQEELRRIRTTGFVAADVALLTRLVVAAGASRDDFLAADTLAGKILALLPPRK